MKRNYDDSKFITSHNILSFANTNEEALTAPVKGIVVELPGLGGGSCLGGQMDRASYADEHAIDFGKNGILLAYMFPGPWSWGNKGAVRYTDSVVKAIAKKYGLEDSFPLVVSGGSMGGSGALMYAADSCLSISGCAAACPVIDVAGRMVEEDQMRTIISAATVYDLPLEEAIRTFSPIERVNDMPDIPYLIVSDGEDEALPEMQCAGYVEQLRNRGFKVDYRLQPDLKHGEFFPEVRQAIHDFIKKQILG